MAVRIVGVVLGGVTALGVGGCLKPNPAYLGGSGSSGGATSTGSTTAVASTGVSTSASASSVGSVTGSVSSTTGGSGSSSTSGGQVCNGQLGLCHIGPVTMGGGTKPVAVALGDLDGDGDSDVVVTNDLDPGFAHVLLGDGAGSFLPAVEYPTGKKPLSLALGDLDGDVVLDVAVPARDDEVVHVLGGVGNGILMEQVAPLGATGKPDDIAIADLDGKNGPDLVVALHDGDAAGVLLADGTGDFLPMSPYTTVGPCVAVAVDDVDHDGFLDVIGADNSVVAAVHVFIGGGDGSFVDTGSPIEIAKGVTSLATGDIDGDGYVDLVAAVGGMASEIQVRLGDGSGAFAPATHWSVGPGPAHVALGDLDADDLLDVVVAGGMSQKVAVMVGNGDGNFKPVQSFDCGAPVTWVAIDDLNGDTIPDIAATVPMLNEIAFIMSAPMH